MDPVCCLVVGNRPFPVKEAFIDHFREAFVCSPDAVMEKRHSGYIEQRHEPDRIVSWATCALERHAVDCWPCLSPGLN